MENRKRQELLDDRVDRTEDGDDYDDSSSISSSCDGSSDGSDRILQQNREIGLTERLTDILVDEGDGDLLLQQSNREDRVLQWLQALDMQVMGACRADERLRPLLKMNVSSGLAEDRLLAHLTQHFEPSEVGMLARCFCIPLVSIRVGKINKQGNLLCPTATRGDLNLTLLPTSDLRLSFTGDDGHTERLFTVSSRTQSSSVVVDELPTDSSGRSFHIKINEGSVFYFWCSEKSKLLGIELLIKMKDLLKRKPTIAQLTGIPESRLGCFATHLRAYLVGSAVSSTRASSACPSTPSHDGALDLSDTTYSAQTTVISSKSLRSRHGNGQAVKTNSVYQGSLSPRSSSFKEGLPRSLSSLRSAAREKLRRRGDNHSAAVDNVMATLPTTEEASSSKNSENCKIQEVKSCPFAPSFLESLGKLAGPASLNSASEVPSMVTPLFSPYYCWCPQGSSTLQFSADPPKPLTSSIESPSLPPLSSLLSVARSSSLLTPTAPINLADVPTLDFPAFLPDPLVRLPMPSSQQIPTFTPLMCDPIVHIPVIDVCSSGQGYLVSAGPTLSTTIPPLHSKLVSPLIPETDSVVEKGARETLRLLISSSSQANPQLMDVLPAVLTNTDDEKQSILLTGSRGLYSGTRDVDAFANSIAAMGLASVTGDSIGDIVVKSGSCNSVDALPDKSSDLGESCLDDECTHLSQLSEEKH